MFRGRYSEALTFVNDSTSRSCTGYIDADNSMVALPFVRGRSRFSLMSIVNCTTLVEVSVRSTWELLPSTLTIGIVFQRPPVETDLYRVQEARPHEKSLGLCSDDGVTSHPSLCPLLGSRQPSRWTLIRHTGNNYGNSVNLYGCKQLIPLPLLPDDYSDPLPLPRQKFFLM